MSEQALIQSMTPCLERFTQDLKHLQHMVDDAELSDANRTRVAGMLLHVLNEASPIPGVGGTLRYVGDILMTRLLLKRIAQEEPEAFKRYVKEFPTFLSTLDQELKVAKDYLGDARLAVLAALVDGVDKLSYLGYAATKCVQDEAGSDWLNDSIVEALVERFDFDEQDVARELKGISNILKPLEMKAKRLQK